MSAKVTVPSNRAAGQRRAVQVAQARILGPTVQIARLGILGAGDQIARTRVLGRAIQIDWARISGGAELLALRQIICNVTGL